MLLPFFRGQQKCLVFSNNQKTARKLIGLSTVAMLSSVHQIYVVIASNLKRNKINKTNLCNRIKSKIDQCVSIIYSTL